ncbi:MAG: hypothetical protein ABL951_17090 [Alphaproteobacteria bacterium]
MKPHTHGILPPSQDLRRRIGGALKPLTDNQIEQVQAKLEGLANGMGDWLRSDLDRLDAARDAFLGDRQSQDLIRNLHRASHDLKGLGHTYGFPIVSVIADTQCKSINVLVDKGDLPADLINAHVDALLAAVRLNIRKTDSFSAAELPSGLTRLTEMKTS